MADLNERNKMEETRLQEDKELGEQRLQEEDRAMEDRRMEENRRQEAKRQQESWKALLKEVEERRMQKLEEKKEMEKEGVTFTKDGKEYKLEEPGRVVGQDGMEAYIRNARDTRTGELEKDSNGKPKEYLVDTREKKVWETNGATYHQDADYVAKNPKKQRWQDNEGRNYEVTGERLVNARFNRPEWDKDPVKQTISREVNGAER